MNPFSLSGLYRNVKQTFWFKVFISFVVVIFVVLSALTAILVIMQGRELKTRLINEGRMITGLLAHSARLGVFAENPGMLRDAAEGFLTQEDVTSVVIYSIDWRILFARQKGDREMRIPPVDIEIARRLEEVTSFEFKETAQAIEFFMPVSIESFPDTEEHLFFENGGREKSSMVIGFVGVATNKKRLHREVKAILVRSVLLAFAFVLSGAVITYFAARRVTFPLARLKEKVRMVGMGNIAERVPVESDDEIGRLASAFNAMAEDLERREEEKRALEEQLIIAKKMEAVGTLARGIAHDFNNILATVEGASYMLQKRLGEENALRQYTSKIHQAIKRAKGLIQSLLAFSRAQTVQRRPFDLNLLIRRFTPLFENHDDTLIEYKLSVENEELLVMADGVQMEQVIMNLVLNARQAMPGGGCLTISTEKVSIGEDAGARLSLMPRGEYALMTVTDTGEGFGEEIRDRIFEPFFTTKEIGEGFGLGLSIVYGIVKQHGGHVEVQSKVGEGATFRIYIPLLKGEST